ncbi:hypothetical protein A2473_01430 [candidate division WWE3 bacterium RIFOXYC2_FULL_42_13]|uniref:Ferredoxin n=2 Tax=Katanobacteria TaxID=422282 RepID=A0A0G1GY82_UNCKA|nr:MAG: hypothetical protein UV89_C0001G0005 [candidate division WWE3 bacterium GW2011_GWB2_43_22]OGC59020.1 MAG: hypothetical protein A2245_01695 [candidate division WWE3 bacterium RIFOXYA2_FULL_43_12]OGC66813.1 MAG: hypothetical protein A2274_01405 [candidate division WWE3 bacterium RIFOXYA12_FULL_43_11]OGC73668.1 MAG: hypothetical protein A2473_01430 [candidate division WWE3 bacterium RIFOXYC2_FULL_42_13]OGC74158.1 MAG: hypothetical protein A2337_01895 [candidate division WWE3 bacterium RIFO
MKISKVTVDRNVCIGSANCVVISPDAFELDSEGISVVKPDALKVDEEILLRAAKSCPVQAISVFDEDGNRIFPVSK